MSGVTKMKKEMECPVCGKIFKQESGLTDFIFVDGEIKWVCRECVIKHLSEGKSYGDEG